MWAASALLSCLRRRTGAVKGGEGGDAERIPTARGLIDSLPGPQSKTPHACKLLASLTATATVKIQVTHSNCALRTALTVTETALPQAQPRRRRHKKQGWRCERRDAPHLCFMTIAAPALKRRISARIKSLGPQETSAVNPVAIADTRSSSAVESATPRNCFRKIAININFPGRSEHNG